MKQNSEYILKWHDFVEQIQNHLMTKADETLFKKINMFLLEHFFMERYVETEDFYMQFRARLEKAQKVTAALIKTCDLREDL